MKKLSLYFLSGLLLLILSAGISLLLGTSGVGFSQLILTLKKLGGRNLEVIFYQLRLPRIILAVEVGAALAMAGASYQAVLRNPLADPYIIGSSAGAAVGASLASFFKLSQSFLGLSALPIAAFLGAMGAMLLVYRLARVGNKLPVETFLLAGVVVGSLLWALVSFLLTIQRQGVKQMVFWLMGTLQSADWSQTVIMGIYLLIGGGLLYLLSPALNLISVGEETALSSGVEVEKVKLQALFLASLLTAAAVSVSGIIGFVGLVVPHTVRILLGADNRFLLPGSAILGGILLLWADNFSRVVFSPQEIPVGIVTTLIGAPFFLWLLKERKKQGN